MAASVPDGIRVVGFMLVLSVGPLDKKVIAMTWIIWQTKCIVAVKTLCVKLLLDSATAIGAGLGKGSRLPVGTEHPVPWGLSCSAPGLPWDVFAIFPKHHPMSAKPKKEKKKKLRQRQTKPMVCTKQRGSPWDFLAAWLHRAVPVQDGHIALPGRRPGAGGLRVGLVKAGPSHFFSTGRSEVCLSSCTSPLATACLRGLPGCAPTGRHQPTAR